MTKNFHKHLLVWYLFLGVFSLMFVTGCGDDNPTTEPSCTVTISNFTISPTTISRSAVINGTATLSGSVTYSEDLGLDDNTLRAFAQQIYYSSNNSYSSNDILLTAFAPTVSSTGKVTIDQIELDNSVPTGAGYLISRFDAVPCSLGGTIPSDEKAVAITINN